MEYRSLSSVEELDERSFFMYNKNEQQNEEQENEEENEEESEQENQQRNKN